MASGRIEKLTDAPEDSSRLLRLSTLRPVSVSMWIVAGGGVVRRLGSCVDDPTSENIGRPHEIGDELSPRRLEYFLGASDLFE